MVFEYIALIATLLIYIVLDNISPLLADISIFMYFLFIYANIPDQSALANFYLFGIIFVIIIRVATQFYPKTRSIRELAGFTFKSKLQQFGISIGLGIILFVVMRLLQSNVSGAIIGTPAFAITSPAFSVSSIVLLGIIENRVFFTLFNVARENVAKFGLIPYIGGLLRTISVAMPFIFASLLFGVFHSTAYSASVSNILFASFVMLLWLVSYLTTDSDQPANIAHGLWNGVVTIGRTLSIAI